MNEELKKLADLVRRFDNTEFVAIAIENAEDVETVEELTTLLSAELEYSGW